MSPPADGAGGPGVRVVYVAGSGRTGSTLLSLLLSQPGLGFNVGQIRDLPLAHRKDAPCSCGVPLRACPFWSPVVRAVHGEDAAAGLEAAGAAFGAFRAAVDPAQAWSQPGVFAAAAQEHAALLGTLRRLYLACSAEAGAATLVDSSKSPELALALSMIPEVELFVLNLVRDPRAVACSWERKLRDRRRVARRCRAWKLRQQQLAAFAAAHPTRFLEVRYEEFAERPRTSVAGIARWAGLPDELAFFSAEDAAGLSWNRQHLFPPTNERMLAERPTDVHIAPREAWRAFANLRTRLLASRLTFPTNLRHGYGLF